MIFLKKSEKLAPYLLITPAFTLFIIFFLIPAVQSMLLSLYKWNGFSPNMTFVYGDNYTRLVHDHAFWNALKNTFVYSIGTVPLSVILGLILAVFLNLKIRGGALFRSIYFLPTVISMVAISVVWNWIYSPEEYGLANVILSWFGLHKQSWLSDMKLALPSLMIMGIWKNVGYCMVILLAGLKSIPVSVHEAASIDGAGGWHQFRYVTLPLLKPTTSFVLIISTIHSFQVFDQVNIMTGGGPSGATEVLVSYLYRLGFGEYEMGYASATAFVLFVLIIIATMLQRKLLKQNAD